MVTLEWKDSKKKTRVLSISGFVNACGTKCARVLNDAKDKKEYFVRVKKDGSGTCTCESRRECYHIKAVKSIDLMTVPEMEQVIENATFDIVAQAVEVVRQAEKPALCPHCHKIDVNYQRYGRCYWLPIGEAL